MGQGEPVPSCCANHQEEFSKRWCMTCVQEPIYRDPHRSFCGPDMSKRTAYRDESRGFPGGPDGAVAKKAPVHATDAGDAGLTPGWGRSPGEGNGDPVQYSCLGNLMDRGAWRATVHVVTKS